MTHDTTVPLLLACAIGTACTRPDEPATGDASCLQPLASICGEHGCLVESDLSAQISAVSAHLTRASFGWATSRRCSSPNEHLVVVAWWSGDEVPAPSGFYDGADGSLVAVLEESDAAGDCGDTFELWHTWYGTEIAHCPILFSAPGGCQGGAWTEKKCLAFGRGAESD